MKNRYKISLINYNIDLDSSTPPPYYEFQPEPEPEPEPEAESNYGIRLDEETIPGQGTYIRLQARWPFNTLLTGFLITFESSEDIVCDLADGGINDTQSAIIHGKMQLAISNPPNKAFLGPKSIAFAVPASQGETGNGEFKLLGYISKNTNNTDITLRHGWSETGPYCSIDVDGIMKDQSSIPKFLEYPTMNTNYRMLTLNMNPNGTVQLIGNNDYLLDRFRLKAIQIEITKKGGPNNIYSWKPIEYFDQIIGLQTVNWITELSTGIIDNLYISNAINADTTIYNNQNEGTIEGRPGLRLKNKFYNILELNFLTFQGGGDPELVTTISSSNINQVLAWDTVDLVDVTFRSLPAPDEYALNILNSIIDEPEIEPTVIYVSAGEQYPANSDPYYRFYSDEAGNNEITTLYKCNKRYEFIRLGYASSHPFYVSDQGAMQESQTLTFSGDGYSNLGIFGSQSFILNLNNLDPNSSTIYYYCTAHSNMVGQFTYLESFGP